MPASQAPRRITRGRFHEHEGPDLREARCLLDEAVFGAKLGVAVAIRRGGAGRMIVGDWRDDMQLEVVASAVVDLRMRRGARDAAAGIEALGREIDLPVFKLDRLRVIRKEWRPGPSSRGKPAEKYRRKQATRRPFHAGAP